MPTLGVYNSRATDLDLEAHIGSLLWGSTLGSTGSIILALRILDLDSHIPVLKENISKTLQHVLFREL